VDHRPYIFCKLQKSIRPVEPKAFDFSVDFAKEAEIRKYVKGSSPQSQWFVALESMPAHSAQNEGLIM
jgi:hypothetical protein